MPFVRFSRDKRGYEHIYLVHTAQGRGRPGSARILYWYRTPPGVKVGREPFDESVRRALEAEYPNLQFDWARIVNTPMPPVDAENWREKRRLMKEMRAARAAEEREAERGQAADAAGARQSGATDGAATGPETNDADANEAETNHGAVYEGEANDAQRNEAAETNDGGDVLSQTADASSAGAGGRAGEGMEERRRRRRRGGRRRRRDRGSVPGQPAATSAPQSGAEAVSEPASQPVSEPASDSAPELSSESDQD